MELQIDITKEYAIALEGGGAKGCYEVGIWKALQEAGVKYQAVAGSSVGALNGALMVMHDLENALNLWENITYSQIMNVDDDLMSRIYSKEFSVNEFSELTKEAKAFLRDGGFDISPLKELLQKIIDEKKIRESDVDLFVMTYSLSDHKELDIDVKQVEDGKICDMLLASAYFPAFKNEKLNGKRYTDGSVQDVLPLTALVRRGYKDILVFRVYGIGVERRVKIPKDVNVITIAPFNKLGHILDFSAARSRQEIMLGYYDAKRVLYGLVGELYYLEKTMSEQEAYKYLFGLLKKKLQKKKQEVTLREMNEVVLPKLAKELGVKGNYYEVLIAYLEKTASELDICEFTIMTDLELIDKIKEEKKIRRER